MHFKVIANPLQGKCQKNKKKLTKLTNVPLLNHSPVTLCLFFLIMVKVNITEITRDKVLIKKIIPICDVSK